MPFDDIFFFAVVVAAFASLGIAIAYRQWACGPALRMRAKVKPRKAHIPSAWRGARESVKP